MLKFGNLVLLTYRFIVIIIPSRLKPPKSEKKNRKFLSCWLLTSSRLALEFENLDYSMGQYHKTLRKKSAMRVYPSVFISRKLVLVLEYNNTFRILTVTLEFRIYFSWVMLGPLICFQVTRYPRKSPLTRSISGVSQLMKTEVEDMLRAVKGILASGTEKKYLCIYGYSENNK